MEKGEIQVHKVTILDLVHNSGDRRTTQYILCHQIISNCLLISVVSVLTFSELYLTIYIGICSQKSVEKKTKHVLKIKKYKLCNPSSLRLHVEWTLSET